ncbi:hypothetical protein M2267_003051 [Ensifer sp. KUDG1]|uniref:hypothetical protein n=1 Tax=Sinorhizobium phage phiLM21 TaxID=1524882 RepID=UPI0004E5E39C|nr:hypothetical protein [Ensifer sp. OV372]YP_009221501.1 hypothetical protein AWJ26_gp30 [Sinorhizobium phage phiLM21]AII27782.1 hypothetical protein phiLM21_p030 [Sinorhizobium phage phiLM21]OWZ93548.1 hypothetical protein B9J07_12970 [Sinorhizobium sp. LM21]SFH29147.1 hypothetical protein SAMN05216459_1243 [Ensifer sp. OV372]
MSNVIVLNDHINKAWEAYTAAQQLAATTGNIEDGIAAGRAWRRWLSLFMNEEQKEFVGFERASA